MGISKSSSASTEYTVSYSNMNGVEMCGDGSDISRKRYAYLENMYKDYSADTGGVIESIPGFRKILSLNSKINGIFSHKGSDGESYLLIHAGTSLYRKALSERDDGKEATLVCELQNTRSVGFALGLYYYILDKQSITRISPDGDSFKLNSASLSEGAYVPLLRLNGEMYEQPNIITRAFREKTLIQTYEDVCYATPELKYEIIDTEVGCVAVSGVEDSFSGELIIPCRIKLGLTTYTVTQILPHAFSGNKKITSVKLCGGVKKIGRFAFYLNTQLTTVELCEEVEEIERFAFCSCLSLTRFYMGKNMKILGNGVFNTSPYLEEIEYSSDEDDLLAIENVSILESRSITVNYVEPIKDVIISIPVYESADAVLSVMLDGAAHPYSLIYNAETNVSEIIICVKDRDELIGAEIEFLGTLDIQKSQEDNFLTKYAKGITDCESIINCCTVCESFDGRIFLSGNESYPNTVFFSSVTTGTGDELYFGALNYFNDGIGPYGVRALLAASDALVVFKEGDDTGGSIYYHTGSDTSDDYIPRIYPVSYVHTGICASGCAISFFDDALFLSPIGVCALESSRIDLKRSIAVRSHNVNRKLLAENHTGMRACVWCGYLVLLAEGRMYLADSRATFTHNSGNREYEWFYLNGIGTYTDDSPVYRYSSVASEGYCVNENEVGQICEGVVYSMPDGDGDYIYYEISEENKYALVRTAEYSGGTFHPATELFCDGSLMIFGTDTGDVCVFNNDKRGVAPTRIQADADFDSAAYAESYGTRIHPDFYDFATHAPKYVLATAVDDCDIPHMTKSTVKHSLVVKAKTYSGTTLSLEALTGKGAYSEYRGISPGVLDFDGVDFSSFSMTTSLHTTVAFAEKHKRWIEKQICLYADSFRAPIGIYSISYRFKVLGRIKN